MWVVSIQGKSWIITASSGLEEEEGDAEASHTKMLECVQHFWTVC